MSCQNCLRKGLPIFPVRYAVYNTHEGCKPPPLSGQFAVNEPNNEGFDAKYTTRILRDGFLYVMTKYSCGWEDWDCYQVVNGNYYLLYNLLNAKKKSENEIRTAVKSKQKDTVTPCDGDYCKIPALGMALNFITIRTQVKCGSNAIIARLSFSDTYWTYRTLKKHIDDEEVQSHMREINVQSWLEKKEEQPHTSSIDNLATTVAEYSPDMSDPKDRSAMRLSGDEELARFVGKTYNPKGADFHLEHDGLDYFNYKLLLEVTNIKSEDVFFTGGPGVPSGFVTTNTPYKASIYIPDIPTEIVKRALSMSNLGGLGNINYGLIVALDDPVGIITYLNRMMTWRISKFASALDGAHERTRKLISANIIMNLHEQFKTTITEDMRSSCFENAQQGGSSLDWASRQLPAINECINSGIGQEMSRFYANYNSGDISTFLEEYHKEFDAFRISSVEPIGQKMFDWFLNSEVTTNYFNDNFDDAFGLPLKTIVANPIEFIDAILSSIDFITIIDACLCQAPNLCTKLNESF